MNQTQALTQAPKPTKPSALAVMASRLSVEPAKLLSTLKATVFKGASDEELMALTVVANEYQLNPFLKEIYAFPAKGGGITPIVSVDGWNKMLIRQPDFDGIDFDFTEQDGELVSCTATIFLKSRSHPIKITEYLAECRRNTDPWNNMPRRMLRNRTLCQASRLAFGFAGVYDPDEAAGFIDVESTKLPSQPPPKLVQVDNDDSDLGPQKQPAATATPKDELQAIVLDAGFTFDHLKKFGTETGNLSEADSLSGFDDIKESDAKRLVRSKAGLLKALTAIKAEEGGAA